MAKTTLQQFEARPVYQRLACRWGRGYWNLPALFRKRLVWMDDLPKLNGVTTWRSDASEQIACLPKPPVEFPKERYFRDGVRIVAPFISIVPNVHLVGKYATPILPSGKILLSAYRDQPKLLELALDPELESFPARLPSEIDDQPLNDVWPMVSRLQSNYFHWIVEWCGRLEILEQYSKATGTKVTLLISATGPNCIRESLALLGYANDQIVAWPGAGIRRVCNLIQPSFRGTVHIPSTKALVWLRNKMLSAVPAGGEGRKLYIPRPHGGWRYVINDAEVKQMLQEEGFETFNPQEHSLRSQIEIFSSATTIVGLSGAALTNIIFAPNATLLELCGAYGDGVFFGLAARLGNAYDAFLCEQRGQDVMVDIERLRRHVRGMDQSRAQEPSPQPSQTGSYQRTKHDDGGILLGPGANR